MTRTYPQSLRQVIAYLTASPFVLITTRYANAPCRSLWSFYRERDGVLWFHHPGGETADFGLEMRGNADEVGIDFDPGGFHYARGKISIGVEYVGEVEYVDESEES
jgi:hypothetical protein